MVCGCYRSQSEPRTARNRPSGQRDADQTQVGLQLVDPGAPTEPRQAAHEGGCPRCGGYEVVRFVEAGLPWTWLRPRKTRLLREAPSPLSGALRAPGELSRRRPT